MEACIFRCEKAGSWCTNMYTRQIRGVMQNSNT